MRGLRHSKPSAPPCAASRRDTDVIDFQTITAQCLPVSLSSPHIWVQLCLMSKDPMHAHALVTCKRHTSSPLLISICLPMRWAQVGCLQAAQQGGGKTLKGCRTCPSGSSSSHALDAGSKPHRSPSMGPLLGAPANSTSRLLAVAVTLCRPL